MGLDDKSDSFYTKVLCILAIKFMNTTDFTTKVYIGKSVVYHIEI